ncbi:unnamed protein product [Callosobruchus maculatus]|nr:unnamed protein product [Callosobruchus maculatus]
MVMSIIATTALYGLCLAVQIGYREVPGLDLNLPPRDLHRDEQLPPLLPYDDYGLLPELNPPEKEDHIPETHGSPSIDHHEDSHGSSEEHSCEEFRNNNPSPKATPIYITYIRFDHPEKLHQKHLQEPPVADVPSPIVLPLFEFLPNNLPQSPDTYPSKNLEPVGKHELLSGDYSRKQSADPASLSISSSDKTQETLEHGSGVPSPFKPFQLNEQQLPHDLSFHNIPSDSPVKQYHKALSTLEEFSPKDPSSFLPSESDEKNHIQELSPASLLTSSSDKTEGTLGNSPGKPSASQSPSKPFHLIEEQLPYDILSNHSPFPPDSPVNTYHKMLSTSEEFSPKGPVYSLDTSKSDKTNYGQEVLDQEHIEAGGFIPIFPKSLQSGYNTFPLEELSSKAPDDFDITAPQPEAPLMEAFDVQQFYPIRSNVHLDIDSFGKEKPHTKPKADFLMDPSNPLGLAEENEDEQLVDSESLEPMDGGFKKRSVPDDKSQELSGKRERRGTKCSECKPFKTNHWQDPPI